MYKRITLATGWHLYGYQHIETKYIHIYVHFLCSIFMSVVGYDLEILRSKPSQRGPVEWFVPVVSTAFKANDWTSVTSHQWIHPFAFRDPPWTSRDDQMTTWGLWALGRSGRVVGVHGRQRRWSGLFPGWWMENAWMVFGDLKRARFVWSIWTSLIFQVASYVFFSCEYMVLQMLNLSNLHLHTLKDAA